MTVNELLGRGDALERHEIEFLAAAISTESGRADVRVWLFDIALCDGSNHEAKFAAILLGLMPKP